MNPMIERLTTRIQDAAPPLADMGDIVCHELAMECVDFIADTLEESGFGDAADELRAEAGL